MAVLRYWDGAAWVDLPTGFSSPPVFRPPICVAKDDATISVNATSYGAFYGPQVVVPVVGPSGSALIHFYAQITLSSGADLVVTYSCQRASDSVDIIGASDANCLYVAPDGPVGGTNPWDQGPGHISGIMLASGLPQATSLRFYIHYRVSTQSTSVLRRRMAVQPIDLVSS